MMICLIDLFLHQLAQAEHKVSVLESENKSLRRQIDGSEGAKKRAVNVSLFISLPCSSFE
jgi:hypothetical protein